MHIIVLINLVCSNSFKLKKDFILYKTNLYESYNNQPILIFFTTY